MALIARAFVEIQPDLSGFRRELRTKLGAAMAGASAKVAIELDERGLRRKMQQAARAAAAGLSAKVEMEVGDRGLRSDLRRAVRQAAAGLEAAVPVEVADRGLRRDLRRAVREASAGLEAKVDMQVGERGLRTALRRAVAGASAGLEAKVGLNVAPRGFKTSLREAVRDAGEGVNAKVGVDVTGRGLIGRLREVVRDASERVRARVSVDVTGRGLRQRLRAVVRQAADGVQGKVGLAVSARGLRGEIRRAVRDAFGPEARVPVEADSTGLRRQVSMAARRAEVGQKIEIPVSTDASIFASGMRQVQDFLHRSHAEARLFQSTMRFLAPPAIAASLGVLAQAIAAVGAAAVATTSALGPLVGLLGGLPSLAAVGAQAFGAIAISLSGMKDLVKAVHENWEISQESSGKAAKVAQQWGRSAGGAARSVGGALSATAGAQRALTAAQERAEDAQRRLTEARRQAVEELYDLRLAAEGAALSEERAALRVDQARQRLREVQMDPGSTELDRRDAVLALAEAEHELTRAEVDERRSHRDMVEGLAEGVEGSDTYRSALQGLQSALDGVASAEEALASAGQSAAGSLGGLAAGSETAFTAQNKLLDAILNTSPAAAALVPVIEELIERYADLRANVQEEMLPDVATAIGAALRNFAVFEDALVGMADVIGDVFIDVGEMLGSQEWGTDLREVFTSGTRWMAQLGGAFVDLANALRDMMIPGQAVTQWLVDTIGRWSELLAVWSATGRATGVFDRLFTRATEMADQVFLIFGNLVETLFHIGRAAEPAGRAIFDLFEGITERWVAMTRMGQGAMTRWFNSMVSVFEAVGGLIGDIAILLVDLGTQPGFEALIGQVRTELLPAFREFFMVGTQTLGPAFVRFITQIVGLISQLSREGGGLIVFMRAVGEMAEVFARALNNDIFRWWLKWVIGATAAVRALSFALLFTGLSSSFRVLRNWGGTLGGLVRTVGQFAGGLRAVEGAARGAGTSMAFMTGARIRRPFERLHGLIRHRVARPGVVANLRGVSTAATGATVATSGLASVLTVGLVAALAAAATGVALLVRHYLRLQESTDNAEEAAAKVGKAFADNADDLGAFRDATANLRRELALMSDEGAQATLFDFAWRLVHVEGMEPEEAFERVRQVARDTFGSEFDIGFTMSGLDDLENQLEAARDRAAEAADDIAGTLHVTDLLLRRLGRTGRAELGGIADTAAEAFRGGDWEAGLGRIAAAEQGLRDAGLSGIRLRLAMDTLTEGFMQSSQVVGFSMNLWQDFDDLIRQIASGTTSATDEVVRIARVLDESSRELDQLGWTSESAFGVVVSGAHDTGNILAGLEGQFEGVRNKVEETDRWVKILNDTFNNLGEVDADRALVEWERGLAEIADSTRRHEQGLKDLQRARERLAQLRDDPGADPEAVEDATERVEELERRFDENVHTMDEHTETGRTNRDMLRRQAEAVGATAAAIAGEDASLGELIGTYERLYEQLVEQMVQVGYTREEVEEYIAAWGLLPRDVETKLTFVADQESLLKLRSDVGNVLSGLDVTLDPVDLDVTADVDWQPSVEELEELAPPETPFRRSTGGGGGYQEVDGGILQFADGGTLGGDGAAAPLLRTLIAGSLPQVDTFQAGSERHVAQVAPAGAWRVWAEPETGGEAYIPLAQSKRRRSTAILEEVARRFGFGLVPAASARLVERITRHLREGGVTERVREVVSRYTSGVLTRRFSEGGTSSTVSRLVERFSDGGLSRVRERLVERYVHGGLRSTERVDRIVSTFREGGLLERIVSRFVDGGTTTTSNVERLSSVRRTVERLREGALVERLASTVRTLREGGLVERMAETFRDGGLVERVVQTFRDGGLVERYVDGGVERTAEEMSRETDRHETTLLDRLHEAVTPRTERDTARIMREGGTLHTTASDRTVETFRDGGLVERVFRSFREGGVTDRTATALRTLRDGSVIERVTSAFHTLTDGGTVERFAVGGFTPPRHGRDAPRPTVVTAADGRVLTGLRDAQVRLMADGGSLQRFTSTTRNSAVSTFRHGGIRTGTPLTVHRHGGVTSGGDTHVTTFAHGGLVERLRHVTVQRDGGLVTRLRDGGLVERSRLVLRDGGLVERFADGQVVTMQAGGTLEARQGAGAANFDVAGLVDAFTQALRRVGLDGVTRQFGPNYFDGVADLDEFVRQLEARERIANLGGARQRKSRSPTP